MRILTVRQPWAYLLAAGIKDVENRTWPTSYRGQVLLHAAQRMATTSCEEVERRFRVRLPVHLDKSAIIGLVRIAAVRRTSQSKWAEGPWCWIIKDARLLPQPIPHMGALGLREAPADVVRRVNRMLFEVHDSRR